METNVKEISVREFRALGFLQELNRQFLHPLGLALEVVIDHETGEEKLGRIWDYRDDAEGIIFAEMDTEKTELVMQTQADRAIVRLAQLGYVIQPLSRRNDQEDSR